MGIAVATYSLRNELKKPGVGFSGIADFIQSLGVKLVELNNVFLDPATFQDTVKVFTDRGLTPTQLTIDGNNFFQKSAKARAKQFEFMKKWIDPAHKAGIKMLRANMGYGLGFLLKTDTVANLVGTFSPILDYIESQGMRFTFENHGGKSSNIDFQLAVKKELPSKNFGYLLDCGNYRPKDLVYENIPKLGSSILVVHAKMYGFNEQGEETTLDYGRIIKLLKEIGYNGDYNIEFEGNLPDYEGVKKTLALLQKYL
jgi:sugar phosphate isomerase/epimerase